MCVCVCVCERERERERERGGWIVVGSHVGRRVCIEWEHYVLPNEIGSLAPGLQHFGVAQVDLGHGLTAAHIGQLTCRDTSRVGSG